jgi:hypothetical protein
VGEQGGGVQGLSFVCYIYDDHSRVAVTRRDYLPRTGDDRRIGALRVPVGRADLAGLTPRNAVRAMARGICAAMLEPTTTDGRA